jgi:aspartyl-tRNA(Asn)/glutamyl-tRNA(Gln) amidotransferase subunit A
MLFLTHGPIAASVADAVTMLEVMAGHDSRDPMARRDPLPDLRGPLAAASGSSPLAGMRIAWSADMGWFAVDDDVRALAGALARCVEDLGATLREATPRVEHPMELYLPIFGVDTRRGVLPLLDPAELYPETIEEITLYPELTAEAYIGLLQRLFAFRSALGDFFADVDVLLTPSTATPAFPLGQAPDRIGGKPVAAGWMTFMPFSSPWNLGTHPTASIPAGLNDAGRPVGLMAIAPPGREDLVVQVAAALEATQPWSFATARGGAA